MSIPVSTALTEISRGHHLCQLYETEEEYKSVTTAFIHQGLRNNEKVIYAIDAHPCETILKYLRAAGIDVDTPLQSGQLSLITSRSAYTPHGAFDPDATLGLLKALLGHARAEGYQGVRALGEMSWVFQGLSGSERLLEYEARLNELFTGDSFTTLCQYDRRRFGPATLLGALRTHPLAIVGTNIYDNFYYVPMMDIPGTDMPAWALQQWLENLTEHQRKEKEATKPFSAESRAVADRVLREMGFLATQGEESNVRLYIP